jgi:hypothetical protein
MKRTVTNYIEVRNKFVLNGILMFYGGCTLYLFVYEYVPLNDIVENNIQETFMAF